MAGRPATARAATVSALRREIIASPSGAYLGSEPELLARLGVSSPTLRQAARLLEQQQLLQVERGNRGGYFGRRPDAGATARAAAIFLEAGDTPISHVRDVARPLMIQAARLAARSGLAATDPRFHAALAALHAHAPGGDHLELLRLDRALMTEVLRLGRNPAISLFLQVTSQIGRLNQLREQAFAARPELADEWRIHAIKFGRAILEGDEALAALFAERGADLNRRWLPQHERRGLTDAAQIGSATADGPQQGRLSLARGASDTLRATILAQPPGAFIGAEEELAARFKVSRHTLRQAAAIAQHDGLLEIRRGVNGGYIGRRPDIDSVVDAVALYLELNAGTLRDLLGASQSLAAEACRMAVLSQAADYRQRLEAVRAELQAIDPERDPKAGRAVLRAEQSLMDALVELAGDLTTELFVRSLYRYGSALDQPVRAGPDRIATWRDARLRLVDELVERDGEAAVVVCHRIGHLLDEWLPTDPPNARRRYGRQSET